MSIFEIHEEATKNKDIDAYAATLHEDYEFISHMDGMTMNREKSMEMFTFLMNNDDFQHLEPIDQITSEAFQHQQNQRQ